MIQYDVNVFGTTDQRHFQVWIGIDGLEDVTFTYSANQASPSGQDFLVGAENKLGQGDMEAVLPTTAGVLIDSTDPTAPESLSYTFRAMAFGPGSGDLVTEMRASETPGVTVVRTKLTVP